MGPTLLHFFLIVSMFSAAFSQNLTAYANDFVDPDYILSNNFGNNTKPSRDTIQTWAMTLASRGPWSEPLVLGSLTIAVLTKTPFRRYEQICYTTFRQQA